jgi:hypothetical protein
MEKFQIDWGFIFGGLPLVSAVAVVVRVAAKAAAVSK